MDRGNESDFSDSVKRADLEAKGEVSIQELGLRAAGGDEQAQSELHRRLLNPVTSFFRRRLGGERGSEAEDLSRQCLSEALLALHNGRYKPESSAFLTYVYGIARNLERNDRRRRARSRERVHSDLSAQHLAQVEQQMIDINDELPLWEIEAMRQCLLAEGTRNSLTPEERRIVAGRAQNDAFKSIARSLGRPLSSVFKRNARALAKLRRCMQAKGY